VKIAYRSLLTVRRILAASVLLAAGVVGCTQWDTWQRETIFAPETQSRYWWREPAEGTEVYDLDLGQGQAVRAWYLQHPDPSAPAVLYLHGARWNLNGSAFRIERWAALGASVLAIDYRGFGDSTPLLPSERSTAQDAAAALRELARRQPDPARRFVYGHSLGGAIALDLATQAGQPAFAGMVLESTFTSIAAMAATTRWGRLPGLDLAITQPFDSLRKIGRLTTPVLFLHGTADRVVPHTMSDELFEAATGVDPALRRLVKLDGASHSGASRSGPSYDDAVREFMRDASLAYPVRTARR